MSKFSLSDSDKEKLIQAGELIRSTEFWQEGPCFDPDYGLNMAEHYIDQTIKGNRWI